MEFEYWSSGEPDNTESEHCPSTGGERCGFVLSSSDFRWYDGQCTVTSYRPNNKVDGLPGYDGCYPARRPFICSKAALPGESSESTGHTTASLPKQLLL